MRYIFILLAFLLIGCATNEVEDQTDAQVISEYSELTCPKCGHVQTEKLPTETCMIGYTCSECNETFHPKEGDCCVFCSYGDHKCPSMQ